ncbi:MAG: aminotransferase class IV [Chloroflexota bacterium]
MASPFPNDLDLVQGSVNRGLAWLNGEFKPIQECNVWVFDAGFYQGATVFDVLSSYRGHVIKLQAHIDRYYRSLQAVRIKPPIGKQELADVLLELVRRAELQDAYICCFATRGARQPGRLDEWQPNFWAYVAPFITVVSPEVIRNGGKLRIASIRNHSPLTVDPRIKTWNRMHSYLALLEAYDAGADDVVLLDTEGYVTEGGRANIFTVSKGQLYTPAFDVLEGITREMIFELAAREGIPAQQARLTPYHLYTADEIFMVTTAGGVMPYVEVDGRVVGDGRVGAITNRLMGLYWQAHTDPAFSTPVY